MRSLRHDRPTPHAPCRYERVPPPAPRLGSAPALHSAQRSPVTREDAPDRPAIATRDPPHSPARGAGISALRSPRSRPHASASRRCLVRRANHPTLRQEHTAQDRAQLATAAPRSAHRLLRDEATQATDHPHVTAVRALPTNASFSITPSNATIPGRRTRRKQLHFPATGRHLGTGVMGRVARAVE